MMTEKPFTVEALAERWSCSSHAIYALIRKGRLPAFRLGGKLLRIKHEDVIQWENAGASTRSPDTGSESLREKPSSAGATAKGLTVEDLASLLK